MVVQKKVVIVLGLAMMATALTTTPSFAESDQTSATSAAPIAQQDSPSTSEGQHQADDPETSSDTSSDAAEDQGKANPHGKSNTRMFGILPNNTTVENQSQVPPVGVREKFKMASMNTFDPYVYPFVGAIATLNRSYGSNMGEYFEQYAASLTDNMTGNFLTTAVLPSVLHQDPRYFELGSGGFLHRFAYAASRSIVTRSDRGHAQFNVSELAGNGIAAGISNLYYPSADRTLTATLSRWGMQVMWDTLSNELKEFWPDVRQKLHHRAGP
jgi:hypothetical protein